MARRYPLLATVALLALLAVSVLAVWPAARGSPGRRSVPREATDPSAGDSTVPLPTPAEPSAVRKSAGLGKEAPHATAAEGVPVPSPAPVGAVSGRVTDLLGAPVALATVSISVPRRMVAADGDSYWYYDAEGMASGRTDEEGDYGLQIGRGGPLELRVEVEKEGFEAAKVLRSVRDPPFEERIDIGLRPRADLLIRGLLLDLAGSPLPPNEVRALFPRLEDPASGGRESGIWALARDIRFSRPDEDRARIDADRASFEIRVRPGPERVVTALFRGEPVGEQPWKDGDPDVELRLDVPSIRGRLGSIEVRVHDAATQAPAAAATVVYERVDFGGSGVVKVSPETGSVRIEGVQPGAYLLFASADGYGAAGARVEVRLSARRGWPRESRT